MTRMRQLPGVTAVAQISLTMLDQRWSFPSRVAVDGGRPGDPRDPVIVWTVVASPDLPAVIDLRALEGVVPAAPVSPTGEEQVLITRCLRDHLFKPGEPAVGRRLLFDDAPPSRVAAVMEDVHVRMPFMRHGQLRRLPLRPAARRARGHVPGAHPARAPGRDGGGGAGAVRAADRPAGGDRRAVRLDRRACTRRSCAGWW